MLKLEQKFKQSLDYKYEMLLRDLRDMGADLEFLFGNYAKADGGVAVVSSWTPTIAFGGASVGLTYTVQTGVAIKIGKFFHLGFRIQLTNKGTSVGSAQILGSPYFAGDNNERVAGGMFTGITGMAGLASTPYILMGTGPASFLRQINASGQVDLTDANFTNTSFLRGTLSGITA